MGRSLDEIIDDLPPERRARVASLAEKKMDDMVAHAAMLTDFRKVVVARLKKPRTTPRHR